MPTFDNTPPGPIAVVGGSDFPSVRAASTVNVPLATPPSVIGGVALGPTQDRVLLAAQTDPAANGVYLLTAGGAVNGYNLAAGESDTHTATAGRLFRVEVTGGVVVIGENGIVAGPTAGGGFGGNYPTVGFLDPGESGVFNVNASAMSGGTATFQANTTLVRDASADAAGEFTVNRAVRVTDGPNRGTWRNLGEVVTLGTTAISFGRQVVEPVALSGATFSNAAPGGATLPV